jgi:tetratricopeptide (TPR) repeat protein
VRVLGRDHPRTLDRRVKRAGLWVSQGRYAEAETEYRDLIEASEEPLAPLNGLAICLESQQRLAEAVEVARESLALSRASRGPEHPDSFLLQSNLARFLRLVDEHEEALELQEPAQRALVDSLGASHPFALAATVELALLLLDMGERDLGRDLLEEAVAVAGSLSEELRFLEDARRTLDRLQRMDAAASGISPER